MKTLGELVANTRALLDEQYARQWSDEMLRTWINQGAADVARKTECLQASTTITAVAATQQYLLPTNTVRVHRVEYQRTGDTQWHVLEYQDFNAADQVWWSSREVTRATPYLWTMWGFPPNLYLTLYPTPDTGGTIGVKYYRLPTERAINGKDDNATIELPEGWDDLPVEYAVYMAKRRDADPTWQEAKAIYEENLASLYATAIRWTDQAGVITSGTGSPVPRWLWDPDY